MRSVDTNVLVRLLTGDDEEQTAAAEHFVEAGAWISHVVLAEVVWVLVSAYEFGPAKLLPALTMILSHRHLTLQDHDVVERAVEQFRKRPALGFPDCLVIEIARKAGHLPLGTFDRSLAKLDGAERV